MTAEEQFLKKMDAYLESDPRMKRIYQMVTSLMDTEEDGETELEAVEIDGVTYVIVYEFMVKDQTYYHLMNVSDPLDSMYRRRLMGDDGEEYLTALDDTHEFELVSAYEQKYILQDLKKRRDEKAQGE